MKTVGELIERNAAFYPQRPAFVLDERSVSYSEYAASSRRLASALFGLGVRRQDRVGVLSMNSIEYFEIYGACEWAGYIAALYNFRIAAPELAHLIRDSAPRVVIFERQYLALVDAVRKEFEAVEHWVCIEGAGPHAEPLPAWARSYEELALEGDAGGPPQRSKAEDLAYIFYTSGTTGRPKGVPWTQAGALTGAQLQGRHMGAGSRLLQITPAFHVGGKGFPLGAFWVAGTTVLARSFDPLKFLQAIHSHRVTTTFVVAPMLQAILDCPQFSEFDVSSLRQVMAAGTATPVPLLRRAVQAMGPVFYTAYGSTECANVAVLETHELRVDGTEDDVRRLGSVGHFLPEIEAAVLGDDGHPVLPGAIGEICVHSPVFVGYWNNNPATIEATRDGWFRTGDLGMLDDEGFLFIVDRKKDMIISGGENIYSREVEEAIARHPAVAMVAVIGVPDAKWGEAVKALVTLRPQARLSETELLEHCRGEIARYKCPREIAFVADLPLTGSGKLDKVKLRKAYAAT